MTGRNSIAATVPRREAEDGLFDGTDVRILAELQGEARPSPRQLGAVAELARRTPDVVECHRVTGDDC
ncbi:MAG TPA: hypothetical protein VG275_06530 [Solirubrobacteraceae bacterium]|jgi:Lrp/AsnC family leucine-responsive transcriptional regulator|nr:hypothetical protein [Solirubrobacteraceae bacterium]